MTETMGTTTSAITPPPQAAYVAMLMADRSDLEQATVAADAVAALTVHRPDGDGLLRAWRLDGKPTSIREAVREDGSRVTVAALGPTEQAAVAGAKRRAAGAADEAGWSRAEIELIFRAREI